MKPTEMPALAKSINQEPNIYVRAAIWLYLLTGMRKIELLSAKWDWIDWERAEMRLPETKQGKVHYVPLNKPARALLEQLPKEKNNVYIFPSRVNTGSHIVNIDKNWRKIRERAKLTDVHLHDLRRTVGSWMASAGVPLKVIGSVLGHRELKTTEIYSRLAEDTGRKALESHGKEIGKLIDDIDTGTLKDANEPVDENAS